MVSLRIYVAMVIVVAILLGIPNSSQAMEAGPIDISQKKEQSEEITIYTPIITGLQDAGVEDNLNQMLAADTQRGLDKFLLNLNLRQRKAELSKPRFIADYSEKLNRNGILSITVQQYSYFDQAHCEKVMNAYTIDLATGKVYSLFQIFRPFVDYNSRLAEIIKKESMLLKAKYTFKQLKDTQPFYLTEEGLVLYFQPYELSAKEANIIRFVIPYDMIRDILNSELIKN